MAERKTPKRRISSRIKAAIDTMVFEGRHRGEAAVGQKITDDYLRKALKRPDVLAYLREQQEVIRTSASARTIAQAEKLMESAASEHVRLGAIEYLNPPVSRAEVLHSGNVGILPGLVIVYAASSEPEPGTIIDATPSRPLLMADGPAPVPHPALALKGGGQ